MFKVVLKIFIFSMIIMTGPLTEYSVNLYASLKTFRDFPNVLEFLEI